MIATRFFFIGMLASGAAFAQTPGMGETRPTPPVLDEQRGPVGAGTGNEQAPRTKPVKPCEKVAEAQREQCLRDERNAAAGATRRAEPPTAPPPQNPR